MTTDLVNYTKEFGVKSKLVALNPGAWNSKEAAKYAYDTEEEYKKNRVRHALHGAFAPIQASYKLEKARQMHKEGKSAAEIKKMIDKHTAAHAVAELGGHGLTGGTTYVVSNAGGAGYGLSYARDKDRKKFKK